MKTKDLIVFLILEILAIVIAASAFAILPSHVVAGGIAGGYFVLSGIYMLSRSARWPAKWKSPTWYVLWIHVAVIALPMLFVRFTHVNLPFDQIKVWGIPAPKFHQMSGLIFTVLIAATAIDLVRTRLNSKL